MSVFSFPRIHVKGLLQINVGTANNDDYSGALFADGPDAGQPVRLADSVNVQALTYGMDDADYIAWIQKPQSFVQPGPNPAVEMPTKAEGLGPPASRPVTLIPAEWNYYGDMGLTMVGVTVIGVADGSTLATDPGQDPLIGAQLSFNNRAGSTGRSTGLIIDVNPEDVPSTQMISNALTLEKDGAALVSGRPSKAVTRWINFQRNSMLTGPNGAAGLFHCVVPIEAIQGQPLVARFPATDAAGRRLAGLVFRYNIFRPLQPINVFKYPPDQWAEQIVAVYEQKGLNPDFGELAGTLSPWYEGEMMSVPVGRLLLPTDNRVPWPSGSRGNGPAFRLAPAVLTIDPARALVSIDVSATFPDQYQSTAHDPHQTGDNPKLDFGPVSLQVRSGSSQYDFGPLPYTDTVAGDQRGWIFDLPLGGFSPDQMKLLAVGEFFLHHEKYGDLLAESEYLVASDQACLFAEQGGKGSTSRLFMNDGAEEAATVRVFRKGVECTPADTPPLTVWEYDTTPNQSPGPRECLARAFKAGQPLVASTERAGNRLYVFTPPGSPDPPPKYGDLDVTTAPMINLRILPNDRDYRQYYQNPDEAQPVGNDSLTFDVIYREVLRNYYLLYPAMSQRVPLNDPEYWADPEMAGRMMQRTQKSWWGRAEYMPRTRDLSASRRTLLQAWCLKILGQGSAPAGGQS